MSALCFSPIIITTPFTCATNNSTMRKLIASQSSRGCSIKATSIPHETSVVDYSSTFSVFPAEACETNGGDSCNADMYPEVKLKPEGKTVTTAWELFDREYLPYDDSKTVLPAEACDVLGGEFCEHPYQRGVY